MSILKPGGNDVQQGIPVVNASLDVPHSAAIRRTAKRRLIKLVAGLKRGT